MGIPHVAGWVSHDVNEWQVCHRSLRRIPVSRLSSISYLSRFSAWPYSREYRASWGVNWNAITDICLNRNWTLNRPAWFRELTALPTPPHSRSTRPNALPNGWPPRSGAGAAPTIADVGYRATFVVCGGVTDPGLGPAPVRCVRNDYVPVPCRIRFCEGQTTGGWSTDRSHYTCNRTQLKC